MIILPDHPVWKYSHMENGKRICRVSEMPPAVLKEIQSVDAEFFECNGTHLVTFED